MLFSSFVVVNLVLLQVLLPYAAGDLLDELHKLGRVLDTQYAEDGCLVTALVPAPLVGRLRPYSNKQQHAGKHNGAALNGSGRANGAMISQHNVEDQDDDNAWRRSGLEAHQLPAELATWV